MSKREKWIKENANRISMDSGYNTGELISSIQNKVEEGIRLGLENADKIKDDEYKYCIDVNSRFYSIYCNDTLIVDSIYYGWPNEPTKEQAERCAQAIIEILENEE